MSVERCERGVRVCGKIWGDTLSSGRFRDSSVDNNDCETWSDSMLRTENIPTRKSFVWSLSRWNYSENCAIGDFLITSHLVINVTTIYQFKHSLNYIYGLIISCDVRSFIRRGVFLLLYWKSVFKSDGFLTSPDTPRIFEWSNPMCANTKEENKTNKGGTDGMFWSELLSVDVLVGKNFYFGALKKHLVLDFITASSISEMDSCFVLCCTFMYVSRAAVTNNTR